MVSEIIILEVWILKVAQTCSQVMFASFVSLSFRALQERQNFALFDFR